MLNYSFPNKRNYPQSNPLGNYWVSRGYEQRISIYYYQNTFRVALICKAEETQKEEKQP